MSRAHAKLKDTFCRSSNLKPGRHSDGGGLYLSVSPGGSKSWVFMWTRDGKRREMGLGPYPSVALASARGIAERYREIVAAGGDPISARDKPSEPTFGECARLYIARMSDGWKNQKHRDQWNMTILGSDREGHHVPPKGRAPAPDYCAPIRQKLVSRITSDDVFGILDPIWLTKHETAARLRGRIELILSFAKGSGWIKGENVAAWRGNLDTRLQKRNRDQRLTRGHHSALPFNEIKGLMAALRAVDGVSSFALEFVVLTGVRTGEALGAEWGEIDLDAATWSIPGKRMKAGQDHRVPLSGRALEILRKLETTRLSKYVFPGAKPNAPLSSMSLAMALRRLREGVTVHGFRSTFRDWAGETTNFPREICEAALAHTIAGKVEKSYQRGDYFEKRRKLMDAWSKFCEPSAENVLFFSKSKKTA